ncbi:MAG: P-loop NTPase [Spirochaetales bacterium]|nr:P-loop NTPase [Spirochaetales bacterium]
MHILPIAGGKGGVGKSFLAANLSIALGQAGKRVVLADLDLGASNLHLILGERNVPSGIGSYLLDAKLPFEKIVLKTQYENVRFIPGDAEIPGIANLQASQKAKLVRNLFMVDTDYLILDLGAGTSFNTIDFFLTSSEGILVTAPALTATLNAYLFLKNAVFRILTTTFKKFPKAKKILDSLRTEGANLQRLYIPHFLEKIKHEDQKAYEAQTERMKNFRPSLVMNLLEDPKDSSKAVKIKRSGKEYLGIELEHLGVIYRDHIQDISLSARLPILLYKPESVISQAIYRIADKVLQRDEEIEGPLPLELLEETYQVADMEAEIDYGAKVHEMEKMLHSGAMEESELIETIRVQQYEIHSLKKENQLLKSKLARAVQEGFKI